MAERGNLREQRIAALIPAAGSGQRMGSALAKPFLQLGGREILARTLDVFEACPVVDDVWVITAPEYRVHCQRTIIERYGFQKVRGVVGGGSMRQESVWLGLQHVTEAIDLVVVHDGVRPLLSASLLCKTLCQAALHGAAIAAVPLKDTLKRVTESGEIETTVPRERLWRVQTPQAFRRRLLQSAFVHAWEHGIIATDEAGLLEAWGLKVTVVPGEEHNIKITTPDDLVFAEALTQVLR